MPSIVRTTYGTKRVRREQRLTFHPQNLNLPNLSFLAFLISVFRRFPRHAFSVWTPSLRILLDLRVSFFHHSSRPPPFHSPLVDSARWSIMGKQAVQQQEAIPILYDGPLAISSGTGDEAKGPAAFLRAALEKNLDPSSASICATFLSKVSSAKRIKDQLQVLQSFKSSIIQICRRNQSSLGDHAGPPSASGAFDDSDWTELSFVYQLLLEWSLGGKTPLPLRRTIHSILETLYDIHQSKDSLEAVFAETIESISASSGDGWKCPLDSLESLLSLAQLRPNLYMEMLTSRSISFLSQKASYIVSTFDAVDSHF